MFRGLILGILLTVLLITGVVYLYFSTGRAPMATKAPAMPFESKLAKLGLHAYLDKLPHPEPQVPADVRGRPISKDAREEILGYGAEGV